MNILNVFFFKSLYNSKIYIKLKLKIKIKIGWIYNIKRFTNIFKIFLNVSKFSTQNSLVVISSKVGLCEKIKRREESSYICNQIFINIQRKNKLN